MLCPLAGARKFSYRRQIVKKVVIDGNTHFTDGQLKNQLLNKPNHWYNILSKRRLSRLNVETDQGQLKRYYNQRGYLFADVEASADYYKDDSSKAIVSFNISEGKISFVNSVKISGGLDTLNARLQKLLARIPLSQPINHDAVVATGFRLRDYYADNGYPLATVKSVYGYIGDSTWVNILYQIAESSYVYNGKIEIVQEGKQQTKEQVIRREVLIKSAEPYNRAKSIESQQRLYSTGLFKYVDLKRVGELQYSRNDTALADIELRTIGRKPNFVNFNIGVGQQEYFNAMLSVFQASVSMGSRNLWGLGRKLTFEAKTSLQLAKKNEMVRVLKFKDLFSDLRFKPVKNSISAGYTEPWFFGLRMPLSLNVIYEPHTKNPIINKYYDKLSGEISLVKDIDKYTSIKFSQLIEFVSIQGVKAQEAAILRLEGNNSMRRRFAVYGQRDTRDNAFIPQKGSYSYTSLDYVGHLLGGDFNFIKGEFYWSRYRLLGEANIVATRLRIGVLEELGANGRSSTEDRFTLGGAKTVRGFAENSIGPKWTAADSVGVDLEGKPKGGNVMLLGNLEIRRPLFWRIGGTAFVDAGNIFNRIADFRINKIVSSTGIGLQFFTPVGPINFEYAFVLQKQLDLAEGSYHLTILYAF